MSEFKQPADGQPTGTGYSHPGAEDFAFGSELEQSRKASFPLTVWAVAALVVIAGAGILFYSSHKKAVDTPKTLQAPDAYAASLPLTQFAMSESANLSGGKQTYLDGHVQNTGTKTMTAATVQVVFANDEAMPAEIETMPLTVIGMRQPYIDVQQLSTNPLKPGEDREFRLSFDTVPDNWNQQMPVVRVIQTELR